MKRSLRKASLLVMLSLVVAFLPAKAFAGYEYTETYASVYNPAMISYYWGWDGDWSVPYLTLSNGWHCSDTDTLYGFTADSYRGKVGYCIAPGVIFSDEEGYQSKEESFLDGVADQNPVLSKDEIAELMSYVLGTGFKGNLDQYYYEDEVSGKDAFGHIWATQILLWELITGERDSDFGYLGPQEGCSPCRDVINVWNPIYEKYAEHYIAMEKEVKKALHCPSFSAEGEEDIPVYELGWDGSNMSIVLEDSFGVLEGYDISCADERIRIYRNGSSLTVYSEGPLPEAVRIDLTASVRSDSFVLMGSYGQDDFASIKADPYSYNQTLMFNVSSFTASKSSSFYVRAGSGEVQISKVSANPSVTDGNCNYSLAGAVYGVYSSGDTAQGVVDESSFLGTIVTDENGRGSILDGIAAGRPYYVKELSAPRGYGLDKTVYMAVPGGTGEDAAVVSSYEDPVNDPIAIVLTKESAVRHDDPEVSVSDVPSLEGTQFTVKYYDMDPDTYHDASELEALVPKKTWVIEVKKTESENGIIYMTRLSSENLVAGSDDLYLSGGGEAILPVGYFTVKETKASEGYTVKGNRYYSGGELIVENNETIVGKVDYDGNISPEGINTGAFCIVNRLQDPVDPDSPDTGDDALLFALAVVSLAMFAAYMDLEKHGI